MSPIKKLLLSLIIGLFVSSIFSILVNMGLKKYYVHLNKKLTTVLIEDKNYDLLFVGSSRVYNNVDPKIVDSVTKLTSFNAGTNGANLFESKMIIESYLEKHPAPKYIFLGLDLFSFNTSNKLFNYTYYLPYAENNKIYTVLNSMDHNARLYRFIPFLQIADYDDYAKTNAINGFLSKTEFSLSQKEYKGFISLGKDVLDTKNLNLPIEKVLIDTNGINYLSDILSVCKKNNINLKLFYAPEYKGMWQKKVTNASNVFNMIDSFSQKNDLSFYRYDTMKVFDNPSLFYNIRHLNYQGSTVFSEIVANEVK
jgi:hypothetical protein